MASDDWICLNLLRYEYDTIRDALRDTLHSLPPGRLQVLCGQAQGMLLFARKRAEATTKAAGIALRGDELDGVLPDISNEDAT
jgi:hypothetical protein